MTAANATPGPTYIFAPPAVPALPVRGASALFPVHRIYCVGRNFADHAIEMGHDPAREPPFFFQKNPDTLTAPEDGFPYPPATGDVHHEVELVVALRSGGSDIPLEAALDCVYGYAVGLDMTRRDLQNQAKDMGRPWDMGKGFDRSAPMGALVPAAGIDPTKGKIELTVNGKVVQTSDLSKLIWSVPEVIANLSELVELAPGDLIMTGTPAGVGAVTSGDRLAGRIAGLAPVELTIGPAE